MIAPFLRAVVFPERSLWVTMRDTDRTTGGSVCEWDC